jgi:hypothetical protein
MPFSTLVRRSSRVTDERVPSERAIASSRISVACAAYTAVDGGLRSLPSAASNCSRNRFPAGASSAFVTP